MDASYAKTLRAKTLVTLGFVLISLVQPSIAAVLQHENQNPLVRLFLPPTLALPPLEAEPDALEVAMVLSNTLNRQGNLEGSGDALMIDGELQGLELLYHRKLSSDWLFSLALPIMAHRGGSFDHFISEYHDVLGLPDGDRPGQPENRLQYTVQRQGTLLLDFQQATSGIGDLGLFATHTRQLNTQNQLHWRLGLELPTGSSEDLLGSGGVQLSSTLSLQQQVSPFWRLDTDAGLVLMSKGEVLPELQKSAAGFVSAGLAYQANPRLSLAAQLDAHTAVFDDMGLKFLGPVLLLNMGGSLKLSEHYSLQLAISEDVQVNASPDVSIRAALIRNR